MVKREFAPSSDRRGRSSCRFCGEALHPFVNLGVSPLCESFLTEAELEGGEIFYPLDVKVCGSCWLVQLGEFVMPEKIFHEYAYFSSFSQAWLEHARAYVLHVAQRFGLGRDSFVIEVASNDGYLLRNFVERGIPCLGIEPAANVARAAEALGVPTRVAFFDSALGGALAAEGRQADLVIGNNVLAQVPDLNSFVAGLRAVLKPHGVLTLEFPHLLRLIQETQFDTIYHEHFSYFSLLAAERILQEHDLRVFDVEELWTHGGSLRIYACRAGSSRSQESGVRQVRAKEAAAGLQDLGTYTAFNEHVIKAKWNLLELLISLKGRGARIVGYGAPGKGNTLLNYCGVRQDFLDFTVDRNPYKHGRFLPGTRIPIYPPEHLDQTRPDYVLILPWNLRSEIVQQLAHVRGWGGRFIIPIPEPAIVE
ncbi:MAG: methyltransferase domain-containing protein [Acetobacteraceae bacterium]|nr:methyltransferase domain-containing protein [Acetobacteraceae bacterium]